MGSRSPAPVTYIPKPQAPTVFQSVVPEEDFARATQYIQDLKTEREAAKAERYAEIGTPEEIRARMEKRNKLTEAAYESSLPESDAAVREAIQTPANAPAPTLAPAPAFAPTPAPAPAPASASAPAPAPASAPESAPAPAPISKEQAIFLRNMKYRPGFRYGPIDTENLNNYDKFLIKNSSAFHLAKRR